MSENNSFLLSPNLLSSEILEEDDDVFSTGYLEDALFEFTKKSKRRRLLVYTDHNHHHENLLSKSYLDSSSSSSIFNWEIMSSHDHENNFNFMTNNCIKIDMDVDIDHYIILGLPAEDGANKLTEILKVYTCNQINYLISFVLVIVLIVHILI
ncbi:uncharacterized protein LOC133037751 isoform X1 [Cannabis sativa]|uniref:uncharacterized protein LOC133037751 isoform X1 n=1 Tax=Cannabis sativa TaxID=3483 RepID=UPI0029CA96CB|nr:uncharacterized protein LOC133037751 isoform X1 [Cannabis sativa]